MMKITDSYIEGLFMQFWCGGQVIESMENMKAELTDGLLKQINGYWSGSSSYSLMKHGGFLIDGPSGVKTLTQLGFDFLKSRGVDPVVILAKKKQNKS